MKTSILRALIVTVALGGALGPGLVSAGEHGAAAKELLAFLKAKERMQLAVQQIVAIQVQRDPRLGQHQDEIRAYVGKYLSWESLEPEIVDQYKKLFTAVELKEILDFYQSETGRKALTHLERVVRDVGKSRNELLQKNSSELRSAIEEAQRRQGTASGSGSEPKLQGTNKAPSK